VAKPVKPVKVITKAARFGDYQAKVSVRQAGTAAKPRLFRQLRRYQLLPADGGAYAAFLGVRTDKKTAVFVLGEDVTVSGQGRCAPSLADCTFLTLEPGESAKLQAPAWAASKTLILRYMGAGMVRSIANEVKVDQRGKSVIRAAAAEVPLLKQRTYGHFMGLLSIPLGSTVPIASQ
jgi:hypothetical protein